MMQRRWSTLAAMGALAALTAMAIIVASNWRLLYTKYLLWRLARDDPSTLPASLATAIQADRVDLAVDRVVVFEALSDRTILPGTRARISEAASYLLSGPPMGALPPCGSTRCPGPGCAACVDAMQHFAWHEYLTDEDRNRLLAAGYSPRCTGRPYHAPPPPEPR